MLLVYKTGTKQHSSWKLTFLLNKHVAKYRLNELTYLIFCQLESSRVHLKCVLFDKTSTTGTGFLDAKQCFLNILKKEERDAFTVDFY